MSHGKKIASKYAQKMFEQTFTDDGIRLVQKKYNLYFEVVQNLNMTFYKVDFILLLL